ncbi:MAG TPA: GNAT family N-acetyltransferase [Thermoleophilaceae bacterium]|nr:GNAT family N-acetyltransferase [Thermoleophilaceae bacterium]
MEILRAGAERIPELQPLWESLSRHHAEVAPELSMLGELRAEADSWAVRRELYEEWLAEPDAFVLIAEIDEKPVGYAVVSMRGPEETWATGDRVAELQTLAVLPGHRGAGIGGALVDRMYAELRLLGVGQFVVGVVASNADAVRFYERLGLTKFIVAYAGQVPPAADP